VVIELQQAHGALANQVRWADVNAFHHSAAQPQSNGDAEGTAGVAWQPLSRAALQVATSSPGAGVLETEGKSFRAKSFEWQAVCAACANSVG